MSGRISPLRPPHDASHPPPRLLIFPQCYRSNSSSVISTFLQTTSTVTNNVPTTLNNNRRIRRQNAIHSGAIHHRLNPRRHPLRLGLLRLPTTRCHTRPHYRNALLPSPTSPDCILPRQSPISQMVHGNLSGPKIRHEAPPNRINDHLQRCASIPQWMDGLRHH